MLRKTLWLAFVRHVLSAAELPGIKRKERAEDSDLAGEESSIALRLSLTDISGDDESAEGYRSARRQRTEIPDSTITQTGLQSTDLLHSVASDNPAPAKSAALSESEPSTPLDVSHLVEPPTSFDQTVAPQTEPSQVSQQPDIRCPICLSYDEPIVYTINCNHPFHIECLEQWLRRRPLCPSCKTPQPRPPETEEARVEREAEEAEERQEADAQAAAEAAQVFAAEEESEVDEQEAWDLQQVLLMTMNGDAGSESSEGEEDVSTEEYDGGLGVDDDDDDDQ
jgi:hypothetical protein